MSEDRPVLELTDIETIDDEMANRLARAGYRTVWDIYQADEREIANQVTDLNLAQAGYLTSGIADDLDEIEYLYRPYFAPEEDVPDSVSPLFDPSGDADQDRDWHTVPSQPGEEKTGKTEELSTESSEEPAHAEDEYMDHYVVEWPTTPLEHGQRDDPLIRRPTPVSAGIAILATILTSGVIAVTAGLTAALGVGVLTACMFAGALWALTSDQTRFIIAGSFLLIVSSLTFLASFGLAIRVGGAAVHAGVSTLLLLGLLTIILDLTAGFGGSTRRRITSSLITMSLAFPIGVLLTLLLDSPFIHEVIAAALDPFIVFLARPETALAPTGLLLFEIGLVILGLILLRARVPAAAVPPSIRRVATPGTRSPRDALRSPWILMYLVIVIGLSAETTTTGTNIQQPTGITGYGTAVFTATELGLTAVWAVSRTPLVHWAVWVTLGTMLLLGVASIYRERVALEQQRRSVFLSTLAYLLVLSSISLGTPIMSRTVESVLIQQASRSPPLAILKTLYQTAGLTPLLLLASYLSVLITIVLFYGVAVMEWTRLIPDKNSGLALGAFLVCVAAGLIALTASPPFVVFLGIVGGIYIWDTGQYATELGARLGRETPTIRAELVHSLGGFVAAAVTLGLTYGAYQLTQGYRIVGSQPQLLLGFYLSIAGALALLFSLRN